MDLYFSHTVPNQHGFVQLCTCRAALHTWEQKWHTKTSKRCVCLVYQPSNQTGSNYEITRRQLQELRDKQAFQIYVASCSETKRKNEPTDVKRDVSSTFQGTAGRSDTRGCFMTHIWQHVSLFVTVVSLTRNDVQWGSGTITPCHRSASILYMNKAVGMMYALSPDQHTMSSLNL